jgi:hypothetical protein
MNMKKSVAGVMAGAMAVSAMAATVSAQDSIALTYDLKTYVPTLDVAKITVVETYANDVFRLSSAVGDELGTYADAQAGNGGDSHITFGVVNDFTTGNSSAGISAGRMTEFEFTGTSREDLNGLDKNGQEKIVSGTSSTITIGFDGEKGTDKIYNDQLAGSNTTFDMPVTTRKDTQDRYVMTTFNDYRLGYTSESETQYSFTAAVAKMTYEIDGEWLKGGNAEYKSYLEAVYGGQSEYVLTDVTEVRSRGFSKYTSDYMIIGTPVYSVSNFTSGEYGEAIYPFRTVLDPQTHYIDSSVGYVTEAIKTGDVIIANAVGNGTSGYYTYADNDVVAALTARKSGGNYYTKPVAVINDAIANHENVVFTFTSFDGYVTTVESAIANGWSASWMGQGYDTWVSPYRYYGWQVSKYDWYNPYFGQHLYTNISDSYSTFGSDEYDLYGSYSTAWGVNLFTGAIVVNNQLTMQLSDTDKFDWGNNTLSFDWNSITADGKITDAKTLLTSALLYTPVEWYWDNLTVVVGDDDAESVDVSAGVEGEGDEIEDDGDEVEIDVEPEEEPEVVETEAATEVVAPVEVAASPATGNAPVALAVIPVALAAAAIVAKKRG